MSTAKRCVLLPGAFAFVAARVMGRMVKKNKLPWALGFAAVTLWATVGVFTSMQDNGVFELDGNAATDTTGLHDWDQVFAGTSGALATAFDPDVFNSGTDDIFQGGGSKDTLGIQSGQWLWTTSKPQGKDDLEHSYAAAYTLPNGDLGLFVGADRYDNSGDSTIAFWFFQDGSVTLANTRKGGGFTFSGQHKDKDLLLISDFTTGGATSTIHAFEWQGDDATGSLVDKGVLPSNQGFAVVNSGGETSPWTFQDKSGNVNTFAAGEFFEGAVDLNAIYGANIPCFATFMAETRSSQSPTATLSDFTPPRSFPLCGVSIAKYCAGSGTLNSDRTTIHYTFASSSGKNMVVHNTGIGSLSHVTIVDTPATGATGVAFKATSPFASLADALAATPTTVATVTCPTGSPSGSVCADVGSIPAKAYVAWTVEFNLGSLSASNTAIAVASTTGDGVTGGCTAAGVTCSASSGDSCSGSVSNTVTIAKSCGIPVGYPIPGGSGNETAAIQGTQLEVSGSNVVVRANFSGTITNSGDTTLSSIAVTDVPGATISIAWPDPTKPGVLAAGAQATYSGTYRPSSISAGDGTGAGRYGFSDNIFVTGAKAALGADPAASATCAAIPGSPTSPQSCDGKTCNICFGGTTLGLCTPPF